MAPTAVHHVGMTVSDLGRALAFWEGFLGVSARWRTVLDRPYVARQVGIPDVQIDAAFLDLPGGGVLELLQYRLDGLSAHEETSAKPGHVHLCLEVNEIEGTWRRALEHGARPVAADGPIDIDGGPNRGARASYLRVPPDGATLELFQPPPSRSTSRSPVDAWL